MPMPAAQPQPPTGFSDIRHGDWIDRLMPASMRPYLRLARLDRPIGTWLLLFPCWWSAALATPALSVFALPDLRLMALFGIGAVVMRGAGCTVNDILDRDLDALVERTRVRPIPSGQVSVAQALAFVVVQLLIGLVILLTLNPATIALGALSLVLVFTYPLMKRITFWPQAYLGLTFNWGALVGWSAVTGGLAAPAWWLYAAGLFWTLGYDTIYAHQDKEDDARIGVKSTALRLGRASPAWIGGFYGLALALMVVAGLSAGRGWVFVAGIAVAGGQLAWQVRGWDQDQPADCLVRFKSNRWFGWLVLAAIIVSGMASGMTER
ncbi:4-hydroxybenzoate octaprenyltransferase [uncultured Gammaproteobacteria bacterium]